MGHLLLCGNVTWIAAVNHLKLMYVHVIRCDDVCVYIYIIYTYIYMYMKHILYYMHQHTLYIYIYTNIPT